MQVGKHTVVSIDYTLTNNDGVVIDSSDGGEPLAYLHGVGGLIPGLEKVLEGKSVGDTFQVTIPPAEAYGERDEALMKKVAREEFESADELEVGMQFHVNSRKGPKVVTVVAIHQDTVVIDGNHMLAGVELNFDVKVREIRAATAEEIDHGHVHGPGGHHHH